MVEICAALLHWVPGVGLQMYNNWVLGSDDHQLFLCGFT